MRVTVKPLSSETWPDLEEVFQAKGCSIARGCWCMFYRRSGAVSAAAGRTRAEVNKAGLKKLRDADPPAGLIGYEKGRAVGWISLGPREDYAKLQKSPVMKPVDDAKVWSIVCFVVPKEYRGRGVAGALLKSAIAWAKRRGVTLLEAYPVDKRERGADEWMWFGAKSMFDREGFEEVARRKPARPIVRLTLERRKRIG